MVPIVNNTVLNTKHFVKRVDLILYVVAVINQSITVTDNKLAKRKITIGDSVDPNLSPIC